VGFFVLTETIYSLSASQRNNLFAKLKLMDALLHTLHQLFGIELWHLCARHHHN
jgi:hypothetical protein